MNTITITAKIENLPNVLNFINNQLNGLNISGKTLFQLELAIEEIYVNIARYAYVGEEGAVTITSCIEEDPLQIIVEFTDSGVPFNPLENEDPDFSQKTEEKEIGGLGIHLIKKNVDSLGYKFHDNKNVLTIKKILNSG
ncbi:ATP-binding protein [Methanobacterium petrolearium]|uniref:ATP-binding protein n=1 Tax=Methanobacterium petrolearium TaxID=710190 RepID=UPI001AEADE2D|nr:ATP-binding protein [Methanobacterium petrolearium]MBP1945859.1 anti-sigma regulatory factor (Ser/Thr protein kinase) [Methanobacterium petrolearium]BDZ69590.1 hypothetical protein GCM10025861_01070 [Methanobacterium petrolearium]